MCTAHGAERLKEQVLALLDGRDDGERVRVLRGGCFGLCEMSANVVVRRWASKGRLPDPSVDRLTVTGRANEVVYSRVQPEDVARVLSAHLDDDQPADELTLLAREAGVPPSSPTANNIRRLRRKWGARGSVG